MTTSPPRPLAVKISLLLPLVLSGPITAHGAVTLPPPEVLKLPGVVKEVRVGGSGRYLIMHVKDIKQLAIFDFSQRKLVKHVPLESDDIKFAAGKDVLVVCQNDSLSRYSLKTLERELKVSGGGMDALAMGHDSSGPLWTVKHVFGQLYDVKTLKPIKAKTNGYREERMTPSGGFNTGSVVRVSADGRVLAGTTGDGNDVFVNTANRDYVTTQKTFENFVSVRPSADGEVLFCRLGLRTSQFLPLGKQIDDHFGFSSLRGRYYLQMIPPSKETPDKGVIAIYCGYDDRPLLKLEPRQIGLEGVETVDPVLTHSNYDQRVCFNEDEKLLVALDKSGANLHLTALDIDKVLDASGDNYLFVASSPPRKVKPVETLRHRVAVRSKQGNVQIKLESGPPGMRVTGEELLWEVPPKLMAAIEPVLLSIKDKSGQEIYCSFTLNVGRQAVTEPGGPAIVSGSRPSQAPATGPKPWIFEAAPYPGPDRFVQTSPTTLQLPEGTSRFVTAGPGGGMWLLRGRRLALLKPDGITLEREHDLGKPYAVLAARQDYLLGIPDKSNELHVLDFKTLRIQKTIKLPRDGAMDIALHPRRPLTYVSLRIVDEQQIAQGGEVVVVDEMAGKVIKAEGYAGSVLAVDPVGKYLAASYSDIFRAGSKLHFSRTHIHVLPRYGHVDWLICYPLGQDGLPKGMELRDRANNAYNGLRMSPDGKFLATVSQRMLVNIWNAMDLEKKPVNLRTTAMDAVAMMNDSSFYPNDMAFHPTLKCAAALFGREGTPKLIDYETGQTLSPAVKLPADELRGGQFRRLIFSPDGKRLILQARLAGQDYLARGEFELPPDLRNKVHVVELPAAEGIRKARQETPLSQLHALRGGRGQAMTIREITQASAPSVVLVRAGERHGTGFIVGSGGLVLTCAHCVDELGENTVFYQHRVEDKIEEKSAKGTVLSLDEARDIALLSFTPSATMPAVVLAPPLEVENGERVAILANPGREAKVLNSTVTQGLVSNGSRELEGRKFIQTSAAVNPGSSGAPVFNEHGLVIGMVTMKANLAAVGFAVPCEDLTSFLFTAAQTRGAAAGLRREWWDAKGRRVVADYIDSSDDAIQLRRQEGKELSVSQKSLSAEDQAFLQLLHRRRKPGGM